MLNRELPTWIWSRPGSRAGGGMPNLGPLAWPFRFGVEGLGLRFRPEMVSVEGCASEAWIHGVPVPGCRIWDGWLCQIRDSWLGLSGLHLRV